MNYRTIIEDLDAGRITQEEAASRLAWRCNPELVASAYLQCRDELHRYRKEPQLGYRTQRYMAVAFARAAGQMTAEEANDTLSVMDVLYPQRRTQQ